jgi:prepilin-type processing-associated H-X9-DG protein
VDERQHRVTNLRQTSELVMIYDGVIMISARHMRWRRFNALFADGHCASIDKTSIPESFRPHVPEQTSPRFMMRP